MHPNRLKHTRPMRVAYAYMQHGDQAKEDETEQW